MQTLSSTVRAAVDHAEPVIALGIATALRADPRCEVQLMDTLRSAASQSLPAPDVVICDPANGAKWLALRQADPQRRLASMKVLIVSTRALEHDVRAAMREGAHGYALLDCSIDRLQDMVLAISRGQRHLCPAAASLMADSLSHPALTGREQDVLQLLAQGQANKAIAKQLGLSSGTVKAHVKSILDKLGARCRTEAASTALRRGMVATEAVGAATDAPARPATAARKPRPRPRVEPVCA